MATLTPEGLVKKQIIEWLKWQKNCSVFPIFMSGMGRHRKSPGRVGTPDILCCWDGKFVAIEVKSKTGKPTPEQVEVLADIQYTGKGIAIVARSVADVQSALLGKVFFS